MSQQGLNILVVEDSADIARNIGDYLGAKGHIMDFATNGRQGLSLALANHYDVVILDLMLPQMDGLQVCAQLREQAVQHIPVLMLTARDTLNDKVIGFSHGADDYLTKPFALEELEVRCHALARRHLLNTDKTIAIGDLSIDRKSGRVERCGQRLNLQGKHYEILLVLAQAYPQVITRSVLCQQLWGDEPTESDSLRSLIYQLRQVLDKPFDKAMLKTVHGVGFALTLD